MSVNLWNTLGVGAIAQAIASASARYGVPARVLVGVMGTETDYGRMVDTSSAGAIGAMQFIPSTASSYNYPLTNTPSAAQFQQQVNAAAQLLKSSSHGGTDWNAAIAAYNPGDPGYLSNVIQHEQQAPDQLFKLEGANPVAGIPTNPLTAAQQAATGAGGVASNVADTLGGIFNQAVSDAKYAAVLIVVLVAAGYMIVRGLGGGSENGGRVRIVPVPA